MRVITLDVVRATMAQMGSPADFGEPRGAERSESAEGGTGTESAEQPPLRKLYRSRTRAFDRPASAEVSPRISTPTRR